MNIAVKMLLSMAFVFSYFALVCSKPLSQEMPFLRSQVFNLHSQGEESQHNRTARSTHPCVSGIAREYDWCRSSVVVKVKCDGSHPACNHVIPIHSRPKCQTVYGYRNSKFVNKCPTLPIDCKCAD
ncbi:uncharacterized protein LOC144632386 [Oculina patagonica]